MQKILKKKIIFYLKIILTLTILYLIFRNIDISEVFNNFGKLQFSVLSLIILTAIIKIFFFYKNWSKYLQLNPDYVPNPTEAFKSLMIGDALRFLVPGGYAVAGKIYFIKNNKSASLISVGYEKFIQIWTSLLFASFASIFYFQKILFSLKLSFFIVILFLPLIVSLFLKLFKKTSFRSYIQGYDRSVLSILLIQVFCYTITLFQYYLVIGNFENIGAFTVLIAVPLILSANLIPFSYAGLGFKETFAIEILSKYNISAEVAVTSTLLIFFINTVLPALLGLYYIFRSRSEVK